MHEAYLHAEPSHLARITRCSPLHSTRVTLPSFLYSTFLSHAHHHRTNQYDTMAEARGEEEADEERGEEEQQTLKKSSSSSFLWRGLRLGKRVAIAGAAITVAPAVIPTIIVGIAFAFPFGVCLAGIAFTDRVMRSLLSTSSSEIGICEKEKEKRGFLKEEREAEERVIGEEGVVHCEDEDPGNQEKVERDEPTLVTAEHHIDVCPPTIHLDIPTDEGDDFGGTGIGEERHAEEVTDKELYNCDPEQETNIMLKHASSTDNKEDIIGDIGMEEEERKMQAERGIEENKERGERDEKDKQNTNEELRIWSSDDSSNGNDYVARGCVDAKGGDKPFEVTAKGEKEVTKEGLEIQGMPTAVPEVIQYPMNSYLFTAAMPNETNQTIFRSNCLAATEKGGRTRVEDVQQPEKMLERRSGGPEDTVQDANEERVNGKEGIKPMQSSYVFESVVKQPSPEQNRDEEGVKTIGLTLASWIAKEAVLIENCAEAGRRNPTPNIENIRVWRSFVSEAPLECKNQMAPLSLSKEYVSTVADRPSDVNDVERPPPTVVETAGVVHFNDKVPKGQDEVESGEPAPVPSENEFEISPLTINLNMLSKKSENLDEKRISKERYKEEVRGMELNYSDTEKDTKIKLEYASSIGNCELTLNLAAVEEKKQMQAESGADKSEDREEIEKIEDEKVKVNEEKRVRSLDYYSLNLNDFMQRGCVNVDGAEIVIELSGKGTVLEKKAEEDMEIQDLTTAVPKVKHHPKTTPFAAVMPDNGIEQGDLNPTSSSVAENGNESRMQEVKQPETMLDGRVGRIDDEVHDLPPAAIETKELFPTVHHSWASLPEGCQIDFELAGLSSDRACSAVTNEEVEGKTLNEANEGKVIGQESMEPTERNYVITVVVSVECKSMVEQNMNDTNAEDSSNDATYNTEGSVYNSFAAAVPLECESEMALSSLSTEYASAVEDHSSYMTDADSGPSVAVVETAELVHFHDEVSNSEETMWEQIYALRTIVGHTAALHSSLVEELKVLYLLTGIEPPVSLNFTSDIMEVSDKLKFLKSVVGVE